MADAYAGSNGRFLTGYQIWKSYERSGKSIDIWDPSEGVIVTRGADGSVVHWVSIEEGDLPNGVERLSDQVLVDNR